MAQTTIQIPINKSTYIDKSTPNTNYSTAAVLKGGLWDGYIAYLDFNHSLLPIRKNIVSAKLMICLAASLPALDSNGNQNNVVINNIPQDWQEAITIKIDRYDSGIATPINADIPTNQYISLELGNVLNNQYGYEITLFNNAVVQFNSSRASSNKPYTEVIYEDVPPDKPTLISPSGDYINNTQVIRFNWQYNSSVGGTQNKFDLLWSSNNGQSWNTISQTTANNYYDVPANTFPSGSILWKVMTYNEYSEASEYSSIFAFYSIGAPAAPTISSISNTARPTIVWGSTAQQVYQIQILDSTNKVIFDTGNVASTSDKSYKIKNFLADGNYTVKIRSKNEYDIYSDWSSRAFTISTTKPAIPQVTIVGGNGCALINASQVSGINYLLYRSDALKDNYICIAKFTSGTADYTGVNNKSYKYFVRAVNADESFADSIKVTASTIFQYDTIASVNNLGDILLLKCTMNDKFTNSFNISKLGDLLYFNGREYAVKEYNGFSSNNISLQFYLSEEELQKLITIIELKQTVLYRRHRGMNVYGTVSSINVADAQDGYIVSLTINKTDYNEELEV